MSPTHACLMCAALVLAACGGDAPMTPDADVPGDPDADTSGALDAAVTPDAAPVAYTIDQLARDAVTGSLPSWLCGQTFLVPTTGALTKVQVSAAARVAGDPLPSDTSIAVYATSAGLPTGDALATSETLTVGVDEAAYAFTFASPVTLSAGMTYAIVVTVVTPNEVNLSIQSGDAYPGGQMFWGPWDSLTPNTGYDLAFQAFISP